MYLPDPNYILNQQFPAFMLVPFDTVRLTLDISGVLGMFGGDEAISAMATVHIYKGRRWLGWYNSPGSYQVAKRYGLVATSRFFKGLFPGNRMDPTEVLEFTGQHGPPFRAVRSGTTMDRTSHLASVIMKQCAALRVDEEIDSRPGSGVQVSIVNLNSVPPAEMDLERSSAYSTCVAIIPILVSIATGVASAFYEDWIASLLIFWGMVSNGLSCLAIGSGTLHFSHPISSTGSPPGHGILESGKQLVLLRGEEDAVNCITRGDFSLRSFPAECVGYCSLLFLIQFIAQLFFIPQASLFGQAMFITSLAVSWIYSAFLASFDREEIKGHVLRHKVLKETSWRKYLLSTRTSAIVFTLCALSPVGDPRMILDQCLPNNDVWKKWKETVSERMCRNEKLDFGPLDWELDEFGPGDKKLLETLYLDAKEAYEAYESLTKQNQDSASYGQPLSESY